LPTACPHAKWGVHYEPSHEDTLREHLRRLPIHYREYLFVDAGAGKGKALLVASEFPFKAIEGVEYSEELARITDTNIGIFLRRENRTIDIRCVCKDISDYDFPEAPLVLYLYNPFQGEVMDRLVANLEASLRRKPRDLWVLYVTPWEDRKFGRSRSLRCIESTFNHSLYRSIVA
jgi:SAM-dependent methyltransferase